MADNEKTTIKLDGKVSLNAGVELPIDGLPASIQRYIEAVCEVYHCPQEFVTTAVLTTASTAVGKKIHISEGKYKNMLVLWFILVARSGSNKSYPIKLVTQPLRELDYKLYQRFMEQLKEYKSVPAKERTGDEPKCRAIVVDDCTDSDTDQNVRENFFESSRHLLLCINKAVFYRQSGNFNVYTSFGITDKFFYVVFHVHFFY